jgi:C1A family cysteine protease
MIYSIAAICLAAVAANALPTRSSGQVKSAFDLMIPKFMEYQETFGKKYESQEAEDKAFEAFKYNDEVIEASNAKDLSYTLGHNEYTDMMWEDFAEYMGIGLLTERAEGVEPVGTHVYDPSIETADSVDWTTKGAVTPVKNQAQCGSCWSFSTTGSLEGAYAIATNSLVSLSEEELVQCDMVDQGCRGGLMDNAFKWIESNGGLCTESAYPYTSGTGTRGTCSHKCSNQVTLDGFKDVTTGDEDALAQAVGLGPVSVAIEADKSVFQSYKSGVLDSALCGKNLDHGVLVVGYGTDASAGGDYWKVKNSWGATWGEEGYIRMARGKDMCGIATQPSYPTGAKKAAPSPTPTPTPTPGPTPAPGPPASTHYEDPNTTGSCMTGEVDIQIENVQGSVCAPACGLFKPCPTDVPTGVTAQPQCALQDASTHKKYCALICSPSDEDAQCGTNASCKDVQAGIGICTYDK